MIINSFLKNKTSLFYELIKYHFYFADAYFNLSSLTNIITNNRVQWGRASDSRLREPGFESYVKTLGNCFHSTLRQLTQLYK